MVCFILNMINNLKEKDKVFDIIIAYCQVYPHQKYKVD